MSIRVFGLHFSLFVNPYHVCLLLAEDIHQSWGEHSPVPCHFIMAWHVKDADIDVHHVHLHDAQKETASISSSQFPSKCFVVIVAAAVFEMAEERKAQTEYWKEHASEATVEAMMLDSQASEIDKLERPEVGWESESLSLALGRLWLI